MSLTPNPASADLQVRIENLGETGGDLTVYDAQGRVVWQQRFGLERQRFGSETLTNSTLTLDVSGEKFAAGVYFVTLRAGGQVTTKRLVVQRL